MRTKQLVSLPLLVLAACGSSPSSLTDTDVDEQEIAGDRNRAGLVLTQSNDATSNTLVALTRKPNGSLVQMRAYLTGGRGSGDGLGSQGSVIITPNQRWAIAVNAGDNTVSAFALTRHGPVLTCVAPSGGQRPVSVTAHGELIYVLNAGGEGSVSGLTLDYRGTLHPIAGSTRAVSSTASGPAQVSFGPYGKLLVVTEKATNRITYYRVGKDRRPSQPKWISSAGETPFGFAFDQRGTLIVSEAFGGAAGRSVTSSYRFDDSGELHPVSAAVASGESAACWVTLSATGQHAFVSNTASGTISSYRVRANGTIALREAKAAVTGDGSSPLDMAVVGGHLYVLNGGSDTIGTFNVRPGGELEERGGTAGLPTASVGLAGF